MPLADMLELARELADLPGIRGADDGRDDGDVQAARCVDGGADLVRPGDEVAQVDQASFAFEDRRHELARHLVRLAPNGAVAISPPRSALKGGSEDSAGSGLRAAGALWLAAVITADGDSGRAGQFGFDLNAEGDLSGLGVRRLDKRFTPELSQPTSAVPSV